MLVQTDLYSFSYKKGSLLPWCKRCGADHFYRDGKNSYGRQLYRCKQCGFRFIWTSDLPKRSFFSNVISFAVDIYTTIGISLRTLANRMKKYFDIKISHEGIRQWILNAKNLIVCDDKPTATQTWHVDETYIKIRGKGFWLWIVFCKESKQMIAWHISKKRLLKEARKVIKKAMEISKGVRPEKIITDGLWQYPVAISKEIGWNWREQKIRHEVHSGIGKNSLVERVNKEVKRRFKWFGSFQALKGASVFFGLFFYHFNQNYPNTG
jgi:transposase-like protein/DNA-directed RNA polymerase subunit RPC12/RpoP